MDWFLYDIGVRRERVKQENMSLLFQKETLFKREQLSF